MMSPLVTVALAIAGWMVAHLFSLRAQRRLFHTQVLERARQEVTEAIREYQDWLLAIHRARYGLMDVPILLRAGLEVDLPALAKSFLDLLGQRATMRNWAIRLEDYEILFPDTREARIDLDKIHLQVVRYISQRHEGLLDISLRYQGLLGASLKVDADALEKIIEQAEEIIKKAHDERGVIDDHVALLDDLRLHLINRTLGGIAGGTVPPRVPLILRSPGFGDHLLQDN